MVAWFVLLSPPSSIFTLVFSFAENLIFHIIFCHFLQNYFLVLQRHFYSKHMKKKQQASVHLSSRMHYCAVTMNNDKQQQMDRTNFEIYTYISWHSPDSTDPPPPLPNLTEKQHNATSFITSIAPLLFRNVNQFQSTKPKIVISIWAHIKQKQQWHTQKRKKHNETAN